MVDRIELFKIVNKPIRVQTYGNEFVSGILEEVTNITILITLYSVLAFRFVSMIFSEYQVQENRSNYQKDIISFNDGYQTKKGGGFSVSRHPHASVTALEPHFLSGFMVLDCGGGCINLIHENLVQEIQSQEDPWKCTIII